MHRLLCRTTPLVLALVALTCVTASAAPKPRNAAVGDYQAAPSVPASQDYSVGLFSVVRSGGKRQIVRTDGYLGIYYPDANECDDFDLPLAAETVPIGPNGRFRYREKTPVEDTFVKVSWRGRWVKPGVVNGTITLKHAGCTSTRKWRGGKVASQG